MAGPSGFDGVELEGPEAVEDPDEAEPTPDFEEDFTTTPRCGD